jgi:hypothetical protein
VLALESSIVPAVVLARMAGFDLDVDAALAAASFAPGK